ncbi:uncharacterized protein LOC121833490 [Ixodes scapularis]|uniref:uncharacterized protein LOC121833490 n=1 Tax=Ixodes scapularis TaxID=6945 RepID=UPI001C3819F9|nr:uncharacterized protein LOC121833490 [Ixodes scapularis]
MESEDSGGEWRRSGRKRCRPKNSDSSPDVPQQPKKQDNTSLTVIFVPVKEEARLTALNSLKVSEALEKLCQECIIQVRPNDRLNLIAVDVRNGQAAKTLLNTAILCGVPVRAYSSLSGLISYGVIQGVDAEITEDEIARNLRAEDTCCKIANVRRLGRSRVVKVAFTSPKLPSYVLLGHVRYPVSPFTDRPLQCHNCNGFSHKKTACQRPKACCRCGQHHDGTGAECHSTTVKCANCSGKHQATSPDCPKWIKERDLIAYSKKNSVGFREAKSALDPQKRHITDTAEVIMQDESEPTISNAGAKSYASVVAEDCQKKIVINQVPLNDVPSDEKPTSSTHQPSSHALPRRQATKRSTERKESDKTSGLPIATTPAWVSIIKTVANISLAILSKLEASWARAIATILQAMLPLLGAC